MFSKDGASPLEISATVSSSEKLCWWMTECQMFDRHDGVSHAADKALFLAERSDLARE